MESKSPYILYIRCAKKEYGCAKNAERRGKSCLSWRITNNKGLTLEEKSRRKISFLRLVIEFYGMFSAVSCPKLSALGKGDFYALLGVHFSPLGVCFDYHNEKSLGAP